MARHFRRPAYCHALHPSTGELIIIGWGKPGYTTMRDYEGKPITGEAAVTLMRYHNGLKGLTDQQVDMMMAASMFGGWDSTEMREAFGAKE